MTEQTQEKSKEDLFKEFIYSLAAADAVADRLTNAVETYGPYVVEVASGVLAVVRDMPMMFFANVHGVPELAELKPHQRAVERARSISCRIALIRWKLVSHIEQHPDVEPPEPKVLAAELARGVAEQPSATAFEDFVDALLQQDRLTKVLKPASSSAPAAPDSGRF